MTHISKLYDARIAADKALEDINSEMREAERAAVRKVQQEFRDRRVVASNAAREALAAYEAAKIEAAASSDLVGRKVVKMIYKPIDRWSSKTVLTPVYGVLEVMKRDTVTPLNQHYCLPKPGEIFVRLLKGDGNPGTRVDNFNRTVWKSVEEEVAQ